LSKNNSEAFCLSGSGDQIRNGRIQRVALVPDTALIQGVTSLPPRRHLNGSAATNFAAALPEKLWPSLTERAIYLL
jgi:hypothetical protein